MKTLDSFTFKATSGNGASAKYDWATWLNGKIYQLDAGVDYTCTMNSLKFAAKRQAKKLGICVRFSKVDGGLVLQAIRNELPTVPAKTDDVDAGHVPGFAKSGKKTKASA